MKRERGGSNGPDNRTIKEHLAKNLVINGRSPGWLLKFVILTSKMALEVNVPMCLSHLGLWLLYREAKQTVAKLMTDF